MKIVIVIDNPRSWIVPYVKKLKKILNSTHSVAIVNSDKKVTQGDVAFYLSCERIVGTEILKRNKYNLVVHESKLPKGRGMSPLTWQILEGKKVIPISLFEAVDKIDSGGIYIQDTMSFNGTELVEELREQQGQKTISLVLYFIKNILNLKKRKQRGIPTYYPKRSPKDSELDINKSIKSQFNLLRVVDNERYPAYFKYRNQKYIIKIYKEK